MALMWPSNNAGGRMQEGGWKSRNRNTRHMWKVSIAFYSRVEVEVFTYCNRFIWFWSLFLLQKSLVSALWTGVPVLRLSITFLGHKMCPITILWKCAPGHQTLDSCVASICVFFKSGWEVENITAMKHKQMALVWSASWTTLGTRL